MFKTTLILLLIIYIRNSLCIIDDLYNAGKKVDKLYSKLNDIGLSDDNDLTDLDEIFGVYSKENGHIWILIKEIHGQLNRMEEFTNSTTFRDAFKFYPREIMIYECLDKVEIFVKSIVDCYDVFHEYIEQAEFDSHMTLLELTTSVGSKVQEGITWIRKYVFEENVFLPNHRNLLHAISTTSVRHHADICNGPELMATFLYRLFRTIMIAEIKANIMLSFVNIYQYPRDKLWMQMNSIARDEFKRRFEKCVTDFGESINIVDSVFLRTCDPANGIWIRNENFYELEETFQTTLFRYHWTTCKLRSCNDVLFTQWNRCLPQRYDSRSSCLGDADGCVYLGGINACVLDSGPYRFQYLNSTKLGSFGREFECPKNDGHVIVDGTGGNFGYSVCGCNCHSNSNKISLLIMQSNVASNKVITGLRFIRADRISYIQPREGVLDAHGNIQKYSERWIPLPKNIELSHVHSINKTNGVFFLEDLRLPAYYALTGVKFNKVTRGNETGFAIQIFGVPFDYGSGKLFTESKFLASKRISNKYLRRKLSFEAVNSIYSTLPNTPSSVNFGYVSLKQSELAEDFGQSTLPLFDGVLVKPKPSTVLGGVGIFHKGAEGYAGFISIRLFPIEYGKFFRDFQSIYMNDSKLSFNYSNSVRL